MERRYLADSFNRLLTKAQNNLGIIFKGKTYITTGGVIKPIRLWRKNELEVLDRYLKNNQYEEIKDNWNPNISGLQHDTRKTKPKFVLPLPEIATQKINSYITGDKSRLKFNFQDMKDQEDFNKFLEDICFYYNLQNIVPSYLVNGSCFIRFYVSSDNKITIIPYNSKYVYPTFNDSLELESVTIKMIYTTDEVDGQGNPIRKWKKFDLNETEDIEYDNPIYEPDKEPKFKVKKEIKHNIGVVQGEWFKTFGRYEQNEVDGMSLIDGALDFMDALNYKLSKEDASLFFHLLPTLFSQGIDPENLTEDERISYMKHQKSMDGMNLISSEKPPGESEMRFLESSGVGLSLSETYYNRSIQLLQYILNIVLLDPERMAAHAQSGVAMRMLHKPVLEYVEALRPMLKKSQISLLKKIAHTCIVKKVPMLSNKVLGRIIEDKFETSFGDFFENTASDVQAKVSNAVQAVASSLISKETATNYLAKDFDIKNLSEELEKIDSDKQNDMQDEVDMNDFMNQNNQPPNKPGAGDGKKK